jgi:flagellar motor protein MotB
MKSIKTIGLGQFHPNKKKRRSDVSSWSLSYGDMVTTLLCFFIIFYAIEKRFEVQKKASDLLVVEHKTQEIKTDFDYAMDLLSQIPGIEVMKTSSFVDISFNKVVFFKSGEANLTNEGKETLVEVMKPLSRIEGKYLMEIQGHADQKKVKVIKHRWWKSNMELSVLRALSVQTFLSESLIKNKDIIVSGYGDLRTIAKSLEKAEDIDRRISLRLQFIK